jgi:hypothetical protein
MIAAFDLRHRVGDVRRQAGAGGFVPGAPAKPGGKAAAESDGNDVIGGGGGTPSASPACAATASSKTPPPRPSAAAMTFANAVIVHRSVAENPLSAGPA